MTPPNTTAKPQASSEARSPSSNVDAAAESSAEHQSGQATLALETDSEKQAQSKPSLAEKETKKPGFFSRFRSASKAQSSAKDVRPSSPDSSKSDLPSPDSPKPGLSKDQKKRFKLGYRRPRAGGIIADDSTQPSTPEVQTAPALLSDDATSLNASSLVWGWFKAYPGLWLSPLALGLLGGWVFAQPNASGPGVSGSEILETVSGNAAETRSLQQSALAAPFATDSDTSLLTSATDAATAAGEAAAITADGQLLADPPSATDSAKETLKQNALDKATEATAQAEGDSADLVGALPGVPTETPSADSSTNAADSLANTADSDIAQQIENQVSSAAQAQAAADAKFVLEERAKAQAAAFAQAKANQAASEVPPQPAPPVQGNPAVDQLITMQVAIAEGDTTLSMGGSGQGVIMTQAGEPLLQLEAGDYGMQCDGSGLVLNGQKLPATVMMAPMGGGLNYVRDRSYRGQIQFICQGNTVLAVNHIDMLQYLYSVVGSEVSASWPAAALKAQSVAARSYALTYYFRPAKEHFHIGDTESYQVYKGTVSEDDRVKAAVQATAGEFISYDGGIVESLYAASDDIVMEAFQGGGMSQLGALDFAEQGYNYLQILGYYYPQTSLGRMVLEDGA